MQSMPLIHVELKNVRFGKPEGMGGSVGLVHRNCGETILNLPEADAEKVGEDTPGEAKRWSRQLLHQKDGGRLTQY